MLSVIGSAISLGADSQDLNDAAAAKKLIQNGKGTLADTGLGRTRPPVPAQGSSAVLPGKPQQLTSPDQVPEGLAKSDWSSIRAAYEAGRHAFKPVEGQEGAWQARNPGQQWTTKFDQRGFITRPKDGGWSWGLELQSYGFGEKQTIISGPPAVKAEGQRLSYQWDTTVQEWFVNDQRGLEHGFTISQRPEADLTLNSEASTLNFVIATRGSLSPKVAADAQGVSFHDASGATVLNYAGLKVWDADGKTLASRFEAAGDGRVRLRVEEGTARYPITIDPIAQQAYLKSSNNGSATGDQFGLSVAVSGDTVVVGAFSEDSGTTGINSTPDDAAADSGAAYVFVRSGTTWTEQAYLKASQVTAGDAFGFSVAVSGDTIVVGVRDEDSTTTGVNSTPNESTSASGAAYVFVRSGTTWTEQAYLKASQVSNSDQFGFSVAVSGDTIVVGAIQEDSNTTGINSTPNESASGSGAAFVFVRSGSTWSQEAYLKASQVTINDNFGTSVALSGDTIVVGATGEDSSTTGVNSTPNESASASGAAYVFVRSGTTWTQEAYLKASQVTASDQFGTSVAMSGDTVVVGANAEDSSTTGINSTPNESASASGAAYVFVRSGTTWTQEAYLKASQVTGNDQFGRSVAVSGDTVVVGANLEDSSTTGVNSTPNELASDSGAAYVFVRSGSTWTQQAYLKASQVTGSDNFGYSVAISGDTVVAGAYQEDSNTTGINSTPNERAPASGAANVFTRSGTTWTQQAYLKASNTPSGSGVNDAFGISVAASGDTVVVGASGEDSSTTGINSTPDEAAVESGAAYVFVRSGTTWTQQAYLKASQVSASDFFGYSVAISGDTVVVGAYNEDSSTTGVNSTPNESASASGAAFVFVRSSSTWTQQAYLKASQVTGSDAFGFSVAVSGDTVVVGAYQEDSSATGVNSTPDELASGSGSAYVFVRSGSTWAQEAYLKASQVTVSDQFGYSVALSGDTIVVGAVNEDSSTTGINSTPNESASASGAAYVFVRSGSTWTQEAYLKASQVTASDSFGIAVAVSGDRVVVGANQEDSGTTGINSTPNESASASGAAYVFVRSGSIWTEQAYLKASQVSASDFFGYSVAVAGDIVVVGAYNEDSSTTGINSTPNESLANPGAAYVFVLSGSTWTQEAYLKASQVSNSDAFGYSVAVAGDMVVVGAYNEDSNTTGINSTPNEFASGSGAAYLFTGFGPVSSLIWDTATGDGATITGGTGTWTNGAGNWNSGTTDVNWNNTTPDNALFGGTAGTVTLGGAVTVGDMTFNAGTGNYTIDGGGNTLTLSTSTITTNTLATISADLAGSTTLTKEGTDTLVLTGTNAYTGATTIRAGTLQIGDGSTTGSLATSGSITNNATLVFNRSDTITQGTDFNSVISGTGAVTQAGSGTLVLSGTNTYTGLTTVSAGVLSVRNANALGATAAGTTVASGAALQIQGGVTSAEPLTLNGTGINNDGALRNISGNNTFTGGITLQSASRINSDSGLLLVRNNNITGAGMDLTFGAGSTISISSGIGIGTGTLTKDGAAVLILSGANTYTGTTTISAGTLQLGASDGNTGSLSPNSTIINNGTFSFKRGNTTTQGVDFASVISGTGGINQFGTGTTVFNGANTYSGITSVSEGALNIQSANALGTTAGATSVISGAALEIQGGITTDTEALTLRGTGVLGNGALRNISGANTYAGLVTLGAESRINSDAGTLTLSNAGTITGATFGLTVGGAGNTTIASIIGTSGGTLTKDGAGTLTLSGANTYTGATTVSEGTLSVTGSIGSSSLTTINGGTLSGTGTVGAIQLNSGGTLNVGAGTLSTGNISVTDGQLVISIGSTSSYGQLNTSGTINLTNGGSGAQLVINAVSGYTAQLGDSFTLIVNDLTDAISGSFIGLTEGQKIANFLGSTFAGQISYLGGTGNDVVMTVVSQGPTVSSLTPSSGSIAGGTSVTLTGTDFTGTTGVTIGGAAATSVTVVNSTTITAVTPAGTAGTASVIVTTAGGSNAANTLYTFVALPEITITESGNGVSDGGTSDFGNVDKLASAVPLTKTFTIKNDGVADLMGIVVNAPTGSAAADYTVNTTGTASSLAPASSTTFTVTFNPSRIGTRVSAIVVDSNDLDENPFNIALTGVGSVARDVTDGWTVAYAGPDAPGTLRNGMTKAVAVQKSTTSDTAVAVFATGYTSSATGGQDIYTAKYHPVTGTLLWDKTFNGAANLNDQGAAIAVDSSGNVVITGYTTKTATDADVYVAKYASADGALLWQKTYAGTGGNLDAGVSVAVDASDNVAVAGYGFSTAGGMDFFAARYSSDGATTYFEKLIDGGSNRTDSASSVAVNSAGDLAVAGYIRNAANNMDFQVMKLDATAGTTLWQYTFNGSSNTDDGAYSVAFNAADDVIATGFARASNYDLYTVKLSGSGVLVWQKQWNGPFDSSDTAYQLAIDSNSDVIVGGTSYRAAGVQDGYVVKYSGVDGSIVWDSRFNGSAGLQDLITSVAMDKLNNVVATGYSQNAAGNYDVLTAKMLAADGGLLWERRYDGTAGKDDSGAVVAVSPEGNVFVAGYTTEVSGTTNFLVKNYQSNTAAVQAAQTITFANPGAQIANVPLTLVASASSGQTIHFTVVSGSAVFAESSNTLLNFTGIGSVTVRASQSGNSAYAAASPVDQTFTVSKAAQTISFLLPATLSSTAQWPLTGVASSGLAVTYNVQSGPGSITGGVLSFSGAGAVTVRASQAGDGRFNAAVNVDAVVISQNTTPVVIFDNITENWRDTYAGSGAGAGNDIALQLSGNDAVAGFVAGYTTTSGTGKDLYLAKYLADGTLVWSVASGASGEDEALSVVVDGNGDVVVAGYVTGTGRDLYVAKHNGVTGSKIWDYTYSGTGSGNDVGVSLALDGTTNVVVGGYVAGSGTSNDFFAAKLNLTTGALVWASVRNRTGATSDVPAKVAVGTDGSVALAGATNSDTWTVKLAAADGALVWQIVYNFLNKPDAVRGLALDAANNVMITAYSQGSNYDIYTAKYASLDGTLIWGKRYNSSFNSSDHPWDLAVDEDSNVYVTGASYRGAGVRDGMTLKYAGLDGSLLWEGRYNGTSSANDENFTLSLDGIGNPVISGYTTNSDGTTDVYAAKHNKVPGTIRWQNTFDGANNENDSIQKVRVDPNGNVWMAGSATGIDGKLVILILRHIPTP